MVQTHLLKLDPPYMILWDDNNQRACKHVATLIEVNYDEQGNNLSTKEYVVTERGSVWYDSELQKCRVWCQADTTISLQDYADILSSFPPKDSDSIGTYPILMVTSRLHHYGVKIDFSEASPKITEDGMEITVELEGGAVNNSDGEFYVSSALGAPFYFFGTRKSLEELKCHILGIRNDFQFAFGKENLHIVFTTNSDDPVMPQLVEELNNTFNSF